MTNRMIVESVLCVIGFLVSITLIPDGNWSHAALILAIAYLTVTFADEEWLPGKRGLVHPFHFVGGCMYLLALARMPEILAWAST